VGAAAEMMVLPSCRLLPGANMLAITPFPSSSLLPLPKPQSPPLFRFFLCHGSNVEESNYHPVSLVITSWQDFLAREEVMEVG